MECWVKVTLTIEADNGEASIILKSGIGAILPPHVVGLHGGQVFGPRGPAYQRLHERHAAADQTVSQAVEVGDSSLPPDVTNAARADEAS